MSRFGSFLGETALVSTPQASDICAKRLRDRMKCFRTRQNDAQQMGPVLDLIKLLAEMIDLRSFSNLWYWISLGVLWSSASHWVIGVPYDMVSRASRHGGQVAEDLDLAVGIQVRRLLHIAETSGLFLVAFVSFGLTMLLTLGVLYDIEFAQAVLLMAFPMSLVGLISLSAARRINGGDLRGEDLHRCLLRTRNQIQLLGGVSIFVTALWGMYQNITVGALG